MVFTVMATKTLFTLSLCILLLKVMMGTQNTLYKLNEWVGGMNWEIGIDIYTLLILCIK